MQYDYCKILADNRKNQWNLFLLCIQKDLPNSHLLASDEAENRQTPSDGVIIKIFPGAFAFYVLFPHTKKRLEIFLLQLFSC